MFKSFISSVCRGFEVAAIELSTARGCYGWLAVAFAVTAILVFMFGGIGYGRMAVGVGFGIAGFFMAGLWLCEFEDDLKNEFVSRR